MLSLGNGIMGTYGPGHTAAQWGAAAWPGPELPGEGGPAQSPILAGWDRGGDGPLQD